MSFWNKKYSVELQGKINSDDQDVLINLYQPLIGSAAISVYNTLIFENKWTKKFKTAIFCLERIANLTNIPHSTLKSILANLSTLNLIRILEEKSSGNIVFAVNKPLPAKMFLKHSQLKNALCQKISDENLESIMLFFKERNSSIKPNPNFIDIKEEFIDHTDPLLSQITIKYTAENSSDDLQNQIQTIENSFKFDEQDLNAIDVMQNSEWSVYFQNCFGTEPSEVIVNSINKLQRQFNLSDGVVNCLISYSYKKNNCAFVFNYIARICQTLFKRKISSTHEAYEFLRKVQISTEENSVKTSNNPIIVNDINNVVLNENVDIEW